MKILYNSLVCLFIAVLLTSCYDEENLNTPLDKVFYEINDSQDPLDHQVYEVYSKYNSIVRYEYDELEYEWNMVRGLLEDDPALELKQQTDRDVLLKGVKFVEEVFFKVYEGKLDKKWMPFKVLLAEQIDYNDMFGDKVTDRVAFSGLNYLAIGKMKDGIDALADEDKQVIKEEIHGYFWGNYLANNERISIPGEFFEISAGKYLDMVDDLNEAGFWYDNPVFDGYTPSETEDLQQFFGKIVTTPYVELKPVLDANKNLKDKYDILVNYIKGEFGIDIQAIGNNQ